MLPFVRERSRYAVRVAACFLGAVVLIVAMNLIGGQVKFGSGNGFVFIAARVLHDMPEVLELKCRQDPDFPLCQRKDEVLAWSAGNHQSFTWVGLYNLGLNWPAYNRMCRELVLFSLRDFPRSLADHAAAAVRNTWDLLLVAELSNGFEPFGTDSFVAGDLRIAFPEDLGPYLGSRQASGALERFLKKLDTPFIGLLWLSIAGCLLYYDGPDYVALPFGQAERGKVTRTLGRVREGVYANLARNAYDAWGNVVGTLDPNGNRRTITWDDILHKFPVREEIEVGGGKPALAMTAGYNLGLGTATESYDFNNNRATFGSDAYGRVTSIALPGDIYFYPTQEFSYVLTDPEAGVTYRYDPAGALALELGPAGPNAVSARMREAFSDRGHSIRSRTPTVSAGGWAPCPMPRPVLSGRRLCSSTPTARRGGPTCRSRRPRHRTSVRRLAARPPNSATTPPVARWSG